MTKPVTLNKKLRDFGGSFYAPIPPIAANYLGCEKDDNIKIKLKDEKIVIENPDQEGEE